ncbi:short chain dehydrogenase/reductase [Roridomyces roridus]|uniref:Short chain dehydrogenase/reductase n=1 Tax=Roridomyces roridus TaxID=1738132 RepID=A0AAD7B5C9_9AGAR|nr:short chain dehydrogenase/reductase [Roridomyces roridus]
MDSTILPWIGLISSLSLLYKLANFAWVYWLKPSQLHRYLHTTNGKPAWAMVTGASDGIGKQFARELAKDGFNVVIHGRNKTKVARVQEELSAEFPTRSFRALLADCSSISCQNCRNKLGENDNVDFDAIVNALSDINLTVLINNAGGVPVPIYQYLHETAPERLITTTNLNAIFPLLLQSKLLPQLIQNSPSLIMNIGSMADMGLPMLTAYAGSKRLLNCTSECISRELRMLGKDVEVLMVRVGEVCGTVYSQVKPSLFEPDSNTMARAALDRVGCGMSVVVGYWAHAVHIAALPWLPQFVVDRSFMDAVGSRTKNQWKKE